MHSVYLSVRVDASTTPLSSIAYGVDTQYIQVYLYLYVYSPWTQPRPLSAFPPAAVSAEIRTAVGASYPGQLERCGRRKRLFPLDPGRDTPVEATSMSWRALMLRFTPRSIHLINRPSDVLSQRRLLTKPCVGHRMFCATAEQEHVWTDHVPGNAPVNWFPGHMVTAQRQIREKLSASDVVIEIRDARAPIASVNDAFEQMVQSHKKPHFVIFSKSDLVSRQQLKSVAAATNGGGPRFAMSSFIDCRSKAQVRGLISNAASEVRQRFKTSAAVLLIVGMPNVGKSTLINTLRSLEARPANVRSRRSHAGRRGKTRRSHVAITGARPGVTKNVSSIRVSDTPAIYVVDTPGVMVPRISSIETGLKLALVGAVPDKVLDMRAISAYLLHVMISQKVTPAWWERLGLNGAEPRSLDVFLERVAQRYGRQSLDEAAQIFVRHFRDGKLGRIMLDPVDNPRGGVPGRVAGPNSGGPASL